VKVALAQVASVPGAFGPTVEHMLQLAGAAADRGAALAVFPATVLSGAYPMGLAENRSYLLDLLEAVRSFAARTPLPAAVPAYVQDSSGGYTEVFLCADGAACPLRRRAALSGGEGGSAPGSTTAVAERDGVSVAFLTGDTPAVPSDVACDVAVLFAPMPYSFEDASSLGAVGLGEGLFSSTLGDGSTWFAFVQGVGAYDDVVLAGGSFAMAPDGRVACTAPVFEEGLCLFDTEKPQVAPVAGSPLVGVLADEVPLPGDEERVGYLYQALVVSVRDYVRKSGFKDVVVGLSGGIDSSVVAALAADALGPEHVLGLLMPGPYSSEGSVADALELAARLGIRTRTVPITGLFDAACPLLADVLGAPFEGLARENLQARLRGTLLMSVANACGSLVLNTGNKSESGMGYSTLYGDTVGAYAPLADVYKGRVYDLARWRNARGPHAPIPDAVLAKAPSAELSEGQTDEGSFGVPYEVVDQVLNLHVERGLAAQDIVAAGFDPVQVNKVLSSCATMEFKRRQEPMGPVVSLKPFVDRGWPVVLGWRDLARADAPAGRAARGLSEAAANAAEASSGELPGVDEVLDAMLLESGSPAFAVTTAGDLAFGAFVSGRGPDMDSCLGLPVFSKN
jgi:NAD+ synthase (glutamine-hydrolysing)